MDPPVHFHGAAALSQPGFIPPLLLLAQVAALSSRATRHSSALLAASEEQRADDITLSGAPLMNSLVWITGASAAHMIVRQMLSARGVAAGRQKSEPCCVHPRARTNAREFFSVSATLIQKVL